MQKIFTLRGIVPKPWLGGPAAVHGVSFDEGMSNRSLYRAGPAVPTFSLPSGSPLLVTQTGKEMLTKDGFLGLSFQEVEYVNVVDVDWHTWEVDQEIPDDQEATDFGSVVMDPSKHREDLLYHMPKIFEVVTELTLHADYNPKLQVDSTGYEGQWLVNCIDSRGKVLFPLVSVQGSDWFLENGEGWLASGELPMQHLKGSPSQ